LALHRHGRLVAGGTVFVGGGAGSVGTALTRLAADAGARVVVSARPSDTDWCRGHGAGRVVDYRTLTAGDGYAMVEEFAPDGVDLWVETSGRHDLPGAVPRMAVGGRVVLLSGLAGAAATELPVGAFYTRDVSLHGFAISNAGTDDLAAAAVGVNRLLASGRPPVVRIGAVLPFAEAARAHRIMAGAEPAPARGRLVLVPPDGPG
ncbi:MAG: zinc-binding dehydrogenase, partial [Actinocatenispora sp.]